MSSLNMFLAIAIANLFFMNLLHAANLSPCDGVDRQLTKDEKISFKAAIATQLNGSSVDILDVFKYEEWSIYFVEPPPEHPQDEPYLFYSGSPIKNHYVTEWSGAAASSEQKDIKDWVIRNAKGIPSRLAECFVWHVTNDSGE